MKKPVRLAAFDPGERGLLAEQLNTGFGGGIPKWSGILGAYTGPSFAREFKYGKGGGSAGGGKTPSGLDPQIYISAQPWVNMGGGSLGTTQQHLAFSRLDPKVQAYIRSQWRQS